jgi:hypothetical protein
MAIWLRLLIVALLLAAAGPAVADELALPRGSRPGEGGVHRSGRSFRDTVEHFDRLLARRGIAHQRVGPYRRRGVLVARFLVSSGRPVRAVHVWQQAGQTLIFLVPAAPSSPGA